MFGNATAFSGFAVDDIQTAKEFYTRLGLSVQQTPMGLELHFEGRNPVFVYEKIDFEPATYTILNFEVDDIDGAIAELEANGVQMEHYDDLPAPQDEHGVLRGKAAGMGPDIAWFKDPAGNVFSVLTS
ncbi:MAG TPA: VOC family protein [Candidatus Saccharibacteria bacterium]|nr:VOC family protein [Candidatus Saccharibacteria bacterium]